MKIKKAQAKALCAQAGYTGEDTLDSMKSWLVANTELVDDAGTVATELEIEDDAPAAPVKKQRLTVAAIKAATGGAAGFDDENIKSMVAAQVQDALKSMGARIVNGRPTLVDPERVGSVKSSDERMYEDRIKSGDAHFGKFGDALLFRHWFAGQMAARKGDYPMAQDCNKKFGELGEQIHGKAYTTQSPTSAAALVPEVFRPDLIKNVLEYGAYSKLTQLIQTNTPQIVIPRRTGGLTAYWPQENVAPTQSTATYDNVTLNAKTVEVLCVASMQLLNDAGVNFADETFKEIALAIATVKDQCLLIGDGTATYGGHVGFDKKYGTIATDGGYVVVGGDSSDAHTAAQLALCIARLPQYALRNAAWTCSQAVYGAVFARLSTSTAVTALTQGELAGSFFLNQFMGFPIIVNNVMNSTISLGATKYYPSWTAGDGPDILFGDFGRASKMLDLLDVELNMSDQRGFDTYSMYFRGVARFNSNVHDVGTSSAAGPVVSFWQT